MVAAVLLFGKKKKEEYTLTVTRGEGVDGTPTSGTTTYEKGAVVTYNYSAQDGYKDLEVTVDGTSVSDSGTITMNRNHTLNAIATPANQYRLTVKKEIGVYGYPESGTATYYDTDTVEYSYTTQSPYNTIGVQLDGETVPWSGTILMNINHTLIVYLQ